MTSHTTFRRTAQLALVLGALAAGPIHAADSPASAPAMPSAAASSMNKGVSKATLRFMDKAAVGGLLEIQAGKLAASQGASEQVKGFGKMLVDDHTKASAELEALAAKKGVTLPTKLPPAKQQMLDKLAAMKGADFDTAFIQQIGVTAHREDIALFDGYAKTPSDTDVRDFARKTLPTLRHHLTDAQNLPKKITGTMAGPHVVDPAKP